MGMRGGPWSIGGRGERTGRVSSGASFGVRSIGGGGGGGPPPCPAIKLLAFRMVSRGPQSHDEGIPGSKRRVKGKSEDFVGARGWGCGGGQPRDTVCPGREAARHWRVRNANPPDRMDRSLLATTVQLSVWVPTRCPPLAKQLGAIVCSIAHPHGSVGHLRAGRTDADRRGRNPARRLAAASNWRSSSEARPTLPRFVRLRQSCTTARADAGAESRKSSEQSGWVRSAAAAGRFSGSLVRGPRDRRTQGLTKQGPRSGTRCIFSGPRSGP